MQYPKVPGMEGRRELNTKILVMMRRRIERGRAAVNEQTPYSWTLVCDNPL
jgi:hypothetical protein